MYIKANIDLINLISKYILRKISLPIISFIEKSNRFIFYKFYELKEI